MLELQELQVAETRRMNATLVSIEALLGQCRTTNKKDRPKAVSLVVPIRRQRSVLRVLRGDDRHTLQATASRLDLGLACALAAGICLRSACAVLCDVKPDHGAGHATQHGLFSGFGNLRRTSKNSRNNKKCSQTHPGRPFRNRNMIESAFIGQRITGGLAQATSGSNPVRTWSHARAPAISPKARKTQTFQWRTSHAAGGYQRARSRLKSQRRRKFRRGAT
jgi:hypothetical protein